MEALSTSDLIADGYKKNQLNLETRELDEPNINKEKQQTEGEAPVSLSQVYRYATPLDKLWLAIGSLCAAGTGVCQPLNVLIFGTLTGDLINFAATIIEPDVPEDERDQAKELLMKNIVSFAVYNSLIGVAMMILSYISIALFNYTAARQIYKIRLLYFRSALNQDISWYDLQQTGDFASRMSEDMSKLEDGLGEKVSMFIHFQVAFVASLILALVKGWELALICLASLPLSIVFLAIIGVLTSKMAKKELDVYGSAGAIAEEVLGAIRTVVAFGGQQKETSRYSTKLVLAKDNNIRRSFLGGVGFGLHELFIYANYALAFWYGVRLILEERKLGPEEQVYNPTNMVTVFFSVMQGGMNFGFAALYMEIFSVSRAAAAKIFSVIDSHPVINGFKGRGKKPTKALGNIVFKDVHFDYPSRTDVKILQGFNLTIKAGETVALVGSSGCGKSTVVQLLQRFYDPLSGQICIDGNKLDGLDLTWLRSNIGVVGQEPILFGTTISENIRYGHMSASQDDIERAAKKANAHVFISALPQGYDTLVGERGAQLSGGQKQRIAIARAVVREPAILLLDEATSALDTSSEAKVQAALDNASKDCTTIIVAHRLSTIRKASRIVLIAEGKVLEEGTHEDLMDQKGAYHNLVISQVSTQDLSSEDKEDYEDNSFESGDHNKPSLAQNPINVDDVISYDESSRASLVAIMKVNAPEWGHILIGCLTSIIMGAAMPTFAVLFGEIIRILAEASDDAITSETNTYVTLFLVAGIVTGLATFLQRVMFGVAGERLTMRLRGLMFEAMLRQEIGWFDRKENGVGSLCAKLSGEAASVQGATGQRIGTILQSTSTLVLSVGLSMYYEWRLGFVALAFAPFILIAIFFQKRLMFTENESGHSSLEKSTKIAVEAVSNIRTVASLGCEDNFHKQYVAELLPHYRIVKQNIHVRAGVLGLARSIMFFAFAACMYYGGVLIRDEGMEFEKVFKVSQALIMGTVSIANALAFAPNFQKGLTAASKIFRLLNRTPAILDAQNATHTQWAQGNIDYSQVCFSYPTRPTVRVLKGLDLSILQGKTVALVGPSGCGKSTVLQLLERYYDPSSGCVAVDQEDVRTMTLGSLRSQLGVVSQEPNLFDRTIGENIAYGDNEREVALDEVIEAAKKANIHTFISSLPLGYDTRLGERGTQLSGGQKQRVAIARALVRNPKVLMLDEATSALDSESEKVVQEALDNAKKGRTCITIAHRLTTIQDADVICVVNQGRVSEMGTHSELLSQKGIYYTLYRLQQGYTGHG